MKKVFLVLVAFFLITGLAKAQWFTGASPDGQTEATSLYQQIRLGTLPTSFSLGATSTPGLPVTATAATGSLMISDVAEIYQKQDNGLTDKWVKYGQEFEGERNFYKAGSSDYGFIANFLTGDDPLFATSTPLASLSGTFAISTTGADLLDGPSVYKYTQAAGSVNDFIASEPVDIPPGFRGGEIGLQSLYTFDGEDGDILLKAICEDDFSNIPTGSLGTSTQIEKGSGLITSSIFVKEACTQIRVGFQVANASTSAELVWENFKVTPDKGSKLLLEATTVVRLRNFLGKASTNTAIDRFGEIALGEDLDFSAIAASQTVGPIKVTTSATDGTELVFTKDASCNISFSAIYNQNGEMGLSKNSNQLTSNLRTITDEHRIVIANMDAANTNESVSWEGTVKSGDIIRPHGNTVNGLGANDDGVLSILCKTDSEHIGLPATSNLTNWTDYAPIFTGFGTVTITQARYRQVGDSLEIIIRADTGTGTAVEGKVSLPDEMVISNGYTANHRLGNMEIDDPTTIHYLVIGSAGNSFIGFDRNGGGVDTTTYTADTGASLGVNNSDVTIRFTVDIEGLDAAPKFLFANPLGRTCYITDVKDNGVFGGSNTAATWEQRDLNTLDGDCSFLSLSSNRVCLQKGSYEIWAAAPMLNVTDHRARVLVDPAGVAATSTSLMGQNARSDVGAPATQTSSIINGELTVNTETCIDIESRGDTASGVDGFGGALAAGDNEIYTKVKIKKVE